MPVKVNIKDVRQLEATLVEKYNVGKSLPGQGNFDDFINFGSYRINGSYTNAPNSTCGTNASLTASMIGTLNVFALGDNTAAITQQLFWLKDEVVNQYQRSYYNNGSNMTWTDWKKLIKCDDFATTSRGGIISEANFGELFRAPDLIQLWNVGDELSLVGGVSLGQVYYLDSLSIDVPIENSIHIDSGAGKDIMGLTSGRRYRVTYEVHCKRKEGAGEVTIKIRNVGGEIYSATEYISNSELRKSITFSVIITNTETITPSIEVGPELTILIYPYSYQVSVEEIKFPYFTSV